MNQPEGSVFATTSTSQSLLNLHLQEQRQPPPALPAGHLQIQKKMTQKGRAGQPRSPPLLTSEVGRDPW